MELPSHASDSRVSHEDFLASRPIPTFPGSEMSRSGFLELVSNQDRNRRSLELIVKSYEDTFMYEDRIDSYVGTSVDTPQSPPPEDAPWFDRAKLESLILSTHDLLAGDYSLKNLASATDLITAYYSLCQTSVRRQIEYIGLMNCRTREFKKIVDDLKVEKNELETQEEIAEKIEQIESLVKTEDETRHILLNEIEKMKRALKAFYFIASLS